MAEKMTNKEKPIFLFVGLASSFSDSYYDDMKKIYQKLGCHTTYLKKKNILNNPDIVKDKIKSADIIYLSGGNTIKLVNIIKEYHLDKLILSAIQRDCVVAGISAGAIALANTGLSDYLIINNITNCYSFTNGLNFLNINICPHANDKKRLEDLKNILKQDPRKIICLENGTALKIDGPNATIIKSIKDANIKLLYYQNNKHIEKILDNNTLKKFIKG